MRHANINLAALLWLPAIATGCERKDILESYTFSQESRTIEQPITRLAVDVDSHLTVEPSPDASTTVDVDVSCYGSVSKYEVSVAGDTLNVAFDCWNDSGGRITIRVPPTVVAARLVTDSSDLEVRGLHGQIVLKADAGDIDAANLEGQLTIGTDAGSMRLTDVRGQLDLKADAGNISGSVTSDFCTAYADAGNINLDFLDVPQSLDLETDAGDIKIRVPAGAYNISTKLDAGDLKLDQMTLDPTSPAVIKAKADAGDITIIGYY
jgi:DUF4097 and DUF4098 domain-containing protein YvlB